MKSRTVDDMGVSDQEETSVSHVCTLAQILSSVLHPPSRARISHIF